MDFNTLLDRIENRRPLDFGDILSKSIDLFKKVWLQGFITIILNFLIFIPVVLLALSLIGGVAVLTGNAEHAYDPEMGMATSTNPFGDLMALLWFMLVMFGGIMLVSFFMYALLAGFHRVLKNADTTGKAETSDLFYYLKGKYFGKTFLLGVVATGIFFVALLLCYLPSIYVSVPISLFILFFSFNPNLSVSEIVKLSFKLGNKNWFVIFGLSFVAGLIAQLGAIACGIGVLFTASFASIPLYYVYKDGVGFEEAESIGTDL